MPSQWLSLLIISLVIIASNVGTAYSECFITEEISKLRPNSSEFTNCFNLTKIKCGNDSLNPSTTDLLDISGEKNGQEKLQLKYFIWKEDPDYAFLNISVRNIRCKKLTIRINIDKNDWLSPTCHTVEFDGTRTLTMSSFIIVSQMHEMSLEFFVEADGKTMFRKYKFRPPSRDTFKRTDAVFSEHIFNYIDMSDSARVRLYIQPLSESLNVKAYNVTIECSKEIMGNTILSTNELYYDWDKSEDKTGTCRFIIEPIIDASKCCVEGCVTTSANFDIYINYARLVIIIASFPSALFALFVTLRWLYIYYARRIWSRRERPNCLLVYSSTHKEHIDVMIELAKYLRACGINAMIDELDAPEENLHNPYLWYHKAFEKATTVIVTASPPYTGDWPSPYQFLDKLALKLIESNLCLKDKEYISVRFPHCKRREDIPLDARSFASFKLPKDLDKLVEKIQNIDYTKICKIPKDEFLNSLQTAREMISNKRWKTSVESSESGMEPFLVDKKSSSSKMTIEISDYSTDDDDEAWLGKKKDEEEEGEIVKDESDDDSVLWT